MSSSEDPTVVQPGTHHDEQPDAIFGTPGRAARQAAQRGAGDHLGGGGLLSGPRRALSAAGAGLLTAFRVAKGKGVAGQLIFTSPVEAFLVLLKTALVSSDFRRLTGHFHQLWAFIAPGLYPHEKRWACRLWWWRCCCSSVAACLLLLRAAARLRVLLTAATDASVELMKNIGSDISDPRRGADSAAHQHGRVFRPDADACFWCSAWCLRLPLVLSVLAMLGIVSAKSLWKFNRYAIPLCDCRRGADPR